MLYEDDAETTAYATQNAFSRQNVQCTSRTTTQLVVDIDAGIVFFFLFLLLKKNATSNICLIVVVSGSAYAPPSQRHTILRIPLSAPAASVQLDGTSINYNRHVPGVLS